MSLQTIDHPPPGQGGGPIAVRASTTRPGPRDVAALRPYGQLPHDLAADPRLDPTAVRVATALLYWARSRPLCWPSDASVGSRVGRSVGTVQRALRRLERAGWIVREKTSSNRTGRLIRLAWRDAGARALPSPVIDPPVAPARDEGDRVVKGDAGKEMPEETPRRRRPEPAFEAPPAARPEPRVDPAKVAPPASPLTEDERGRLGVLPEPARARVVAWLATGDPICVAEARRRLTPVTAVAPPPASVAEMIERIGESPENVARAAELLAQDLGDRKSWGALHAACKRVWEGSIPPGAMVTAWREATSGRARNPGAVFTHVLHRESRG